MYHLKYLKHSVQWCSGHFLPHSTFLLCESERQILQMNGNTHSFLWLCAFLTGEPVKHHTATMSSHPSNSCGYRFSGFLSHLSHSSAEMKTCTDSWEPCASRFLPTPYSWRGWILFLMVGQLSLQLQTDLASSSVPSHGSLSSPSLPYSACVAQPCCSFSHLPCCFCPCKGPSSAAAPTRHLKTWGFFSVKFFSGFYMDSVGKVSVNV